MIKKNFLQKFINFQTFRKQEGPKISLKYIDKKSISDKLGEGVKGTEFFYFGELPAICKTTIKKRVSLII